MRFRFQGYLDTPDNLLDLAREFQEKKQGRALTDQDLIDLFRAAFIEKLEEDLTPDDGMSYSDVTFVLLDS